MSLRKIKTRWFETISQSFRFYSILTSNTIQHLFYSIYNFYTYHSRIANSFIFLVLVIVTLTYYFSPLFMLIVISFYFFLELFTSFFVMHYYLHGFYLLFFSIQPFFVIFSSIAHFFVSFVKGKWRE